MTEEASCGISSYSSYITIVINIYSTGYRIWGSISATYLNYSDINYNCIILPKFVTASSDLVAPGLQGLITSGTNQISTKHLLFCCPYRHMHGTTLCFITKSGTLAKPHFFMDNEKCNRTIS